jgi:hypothetical protein
MVLHALGSIDLLASFVVLYFGPETFLPLATFVGSIVGVLMMFWRQIVAKTRRAFRFVLRKGVSGSDRPGL